MNKKRKQDTILIHSGRDPQKHAGLVNTPVFRGSTVLFRDVESYEHRDPDNYKVMRYGIHGTPNPSKVSKAESHGCVRLTNWDAAWLGTNAKKGTPVVFIEQPEAAQKS